MPATMERILAGRGLDAVRRPLFSLSDLLPPPPTCFRFLGFLFPGSYVELFFVFVLVSISINKKKSKGAS